MSVMEGTEILLRHLEKSDLHDFTSLVTDPLYGKYSPLGSLTNDIANGVANHILANYDNEGYEFWAVLDKKYNKIAGFVGYHPVTFENKTHEMYFVGPRTILENTRCAADSNVVPRCRATVSVNPYPSGVHKSLCALSSHAQTSWSRKAANSSTVTAT